MVGLKESRMAGLDLRPKRGLNDELSKMRKRKRR